MGRNKKKSCPRCGEEDLSKFGKHAGRADGLQANCRVCQRWYKNAEQRKWVTPEEYTAAELAQDKRCALCRKPSLKEALHADHHHATGRFRGLLCRHCNFQLGWLEKNPDWVERAKKYLNFQLTFSTIEEQGHFPRGDVNMQFL